MSTETVTRNVERFAKAFHPDQKYGCVTYAQHGDDLMLVNLFHLMGIEKPSYLDLGAHHPHVISNTALLYEKGSRGVNVEANPILIEAFKIQRPEDTNVNIGVGLESGTFPFYMYSETSGRNTFSKDEVETLKGILHVRNTIELPMLTVREIVEKYCGGRYPDLLTTDLEGLDYAVLKSADFSFSKPKVIVSEIRRGESALVKNLLEERDYFVYCRMGENLFFVDKTYKYLVY